MLGRLLYVPRPAFGNEAENVFDETHRRIAIALDDVEGVGPDIELERMADASDLDSCRASLGRLADKLGLSGSERRGYLELLLEKNAGGDS